MRDVASAKLKWFKVRGASIDKAYSQIYALTNAEVSGKRTMRDDIEEAEQHLQKIKEVYPQASQSVLRTVHSSQGIRRKKTADSLIIVTSPKIPPETAAQTAQTIEKTPEKNYSPIATLKDFGPLPDEPKQRTRPPTAINLQRKTRPLTATCLQKYLSPSYSQKASPMASMRKDSKETEKTTKENTNTLPTETLTKTISPSTSTQQLKTKASGSIFIIDSPQLAPRNLMQRTQMSAKKNLSSESPALQNLRKTLEVSKEISLAEKMRMRRNMKYDSRHILQRHKSYESNSSTRIPSRNRSQQDSESNEENSCRLLNIAVKGNLNKALDELRFSFPMNASDIEATNKILNKYAKIEEPCFFNPMKVNSIRSCRPSKFIYIF